MNHEATIANEVCDSVPCENTKHFLDVDGTKALIGVNGINLEEEAMKVGLQLTQQLKEDPEVEEWQLIYYLAKGLHERFPTIRLSQVKFFCPVLNAFCRGIWGEVPGSCESEQGRQWVEFVEHFAKITDFKPVNPLEKAWELSLKKPVVPPFSISPDCNRVYSFLYHLHILLKGRAMGISSEWLGKKLNRDWRYAAQILKTMRACRVLAVVTAGSRDDKQVTKYRFVCDGTCCRNAQNTCGQCDSPCTGEGNGLLPSK
jgi:hypothetical protein